MIDKALDKRKEKLEKSKDLMVDVRPEFAKALSQTLSFSSKLPLFISLSSTKGEKCLHDEEFVQEEEDQERDGEVQAG